MVARSRAPQAHHRPRPQQRYASRRSSQALTCCWLLGAGAVFRRVEPALCVCVGTRFKQVLDLVGSRDFLTAEAAQSLLKPLTAPGGAISKVCALRAFTQAHGEGPSDNTPASRYQVRLRSLCSAGPLQHQELRPGGRRSGSQGPPRCARVPDARRHLGRHCWPPRKRWDATPLPSARAISLHNSARGFTLQPFGSSLVDTWQA
jgi:hypothetical protein